MFYFCINKLLNYLNPLTLIFNADMLLFLIPATTNQRLQHCIIYFQGILSLILIDQYLRIKLKFNSYMIFLRLCLSLEAKIK